MTETSAVGHVAAAVEYAVAVAPALEHAAVLVAENVAVVAGCAVVVPAVVGDVAAAEYAVAVAPALEHAAVPAVENVAVVVGRVVAEAVQSAAVAEVENVVLVSVGFVYRRVGPAGHRHEKQLQEAKTKRK